MWSDNITIILSVVALLLSTTNLLFTYIKRLKEFQDKALERHKIKLSIKKMEFEHDLMNSIDSKSDSIDIYLKLTKNMVNEIYPDNAFIVSIKLISKSNAENPLESEVITLASYPDSRNIEPVYKIKNNTDFSTIIGDNNEYFFVSDLKEYSVLKNYINESNNYIECYNTSIVFPIQKGNKNSEDIIGFLCVTSPQRLNDVKKNKMLMDIIKSAATIAYKYLTENKLRQEVISIKNN